MIERDFLLLQIRLDRRWRFERTRLGIEEIRAIGKGQPAAKGDASIQVDARDTGFARVDQHQAGRDDHV